MPSLRRVRIVRAMAMPPPPADTDAADSTSSGSGLTGYVVKVKEEDCDAAATTSIALDGERESTTGSESKDTGSAKSTTAQAKESSVKKSKPTLKKRKRKKSGKTEKKKKKKYAIDANESNQYNKTYINSSDSKGRKRKGAYGKTAPWKVRLEQLKQYKAVHGNCDVPFDYKEDIYKAGEMGEESTFALSFIARRQKIDDDKGAHRDSGEHWICVGFGTGQILGSSISGVETVL